jgi:tetratricopeptide (TPR) repeat protein
MEHGCRSRLTLLLGVIAVLAMGAGASAQSPTAQSAKAAELSRAGKYSEALPLAQAAVATLERTNPNSRDFAGTLNNLAQLYGDLGWDDKAEPLLKRALAIGGDAADNVDFRWSQGRSRIVTRRSAATSDVSLSQ